MDTEADAVGSGSQDTAAAGHAAGRSLWVEEPAGTPRLPDPVRAAAVRALLIAAVTLVEAVISTLAVLASSWFAAPAILVTVMSTVVATWGAVDVWITHQVWRQRYGVVSSPSSAARARRRERRSARRAARARSRNRGGIPGLSSGA